MSLKTQLLLSTILTFGNLNAYAQTHNWIRVNPGGGGAFSTVEAGPTGIVVAGSDLSGVYISLNQGSSWGVIGAAQGLTSTHVSGFGFHHSNPNIIFVGTDNGIYRTGDMGSSFSQVLSGGYITDIKGSPASNSRFYATYHPLYNSTEGKIYRSSDGGLTFSPVSVDLPNDLRLLKIIVDPSDEDVLYVLSGQGRFACGPARLYKSVNAGENWIQLASDLGEILDISLKPGDPGTVYLTNMHADCAAMYYWTDLIGNLYRSSDGGANFDSIFDVSGVIWPKSPSTIRIIDPREPFPWNPTGGTWTTHDSGASWSQTGDVDDWDYGYQGEALWSYGSSFNGITKTLGKDLSDPDRIYWVNSQWVFSSSDGGSTFVNLHTEEVSPGWWTSTGFDNVVMMDMAISPANPDVIYAGYWDLGFWRSLDHGASWQASNEVDYSAGWDGFGGNAFSIAVDPDNASKVWTTAQGSFDEPSFLLRSDNAAAKGSWTRIGTGLTGSNATLGLSVDPSSSSLQRILFVTDGGNVYRSVNDGADWNLVLGNGGLRTTAVDQLNGSIVYAGGESGFFRSLNGGASGSWESSGLMEMTGGVSGPPWTFAWEGIYDIAVDPDVEGSVYLAAFGNGKGLYHSQDSGATWVKLLTDDYLRAIAVKSGDNDVLYVGSSSALEEGGYAPGSKGVLYSKDGGSNWHDASNGMAYPFALTLEFDHRIDGNIFVGSPGTGFQFTQAASSSTLAVTYLKPLQAQSRTYDVILTWQTTLDPNSDYFRVERSHDLRNWELLGKVTANDMTGLYKFIDREPMSGLQYYRVVEIEVNGNSFSSPTVSVDWNEFKTHIFPNPVRDKIHWHSGQGANKIILMNTMGSVLKEADFNQGIMDCRELRAGLYYAKILGPQLTKIIPIVKVD